jgi:hypothetical protein
MCCAAFDYSIITGIMHSVMVVSLSISIFLLYLVIWFVEMLNCVFDPGMACHCKCLNFSICLKSALNFICQVNLI